MIQVYKASAGSGKTYTLAHLYIKLLLDSWERDKEIYRKILAVTFTNKATAEMKERILKYLYEDGKKDARVKQLLTAILNDYGSFSISTIDRFFQQALRAFSRELGRGASYQIELDRDSIIREAMDRILDSITPDDKDLLSWLGSAMNDALSEGRRFAADEGLFDVGRQLKNEEHRILVDSLKMSDRDLYDPERLSSLRKECRRIISEFHRKAACEADAVKDSVSPRVIKWLKPYLKPDAGEKLKVPNPTTLKETDGSGFAGLWDGNEYRTYCTAWTIDRMVFSLGFARRFYEVFDELLDEKNVMCLDESNTILRDIIDGSDAPFIYERLGVRYSHFLLDEFQDTSNVQWENFLPLLRESEANSAPDEMTDLIVGDVKQSIYRWRNSDWSLLENTVPSEFPTAQIRTLARNWRSERGIVDFNNRFYRYAADRLGISSVYSDVQQQSGGGNAGRVRVSFCDDQCAAVVESVRDACSRGAVYGDIAVIVRDHSKGGRVADALLSAGIPVISDDSLKITSSLTVRRILSVLHNVESPDDRLNSYIAGTLGIDIPKSYSSLADLCEALARSLKALDPVKFEGETLFVQTFLDDVREWTAVNGNNLRYFLEHIDSKDIFVLSPETSDSVRVITIHKSKGLEFPYVIFPYAEEVDSSRAETHWCHLDAGACSLPEVFDGVYPVKFTKDSYDTWFEKDAVANGSKVTVDNLNLFYVCTTRAEKELHIISEVPSKTFREQLAKSASCLVGEAPARILYAFVSGMDEWTSGEPYDFTAMDRKKERGPERFPASFDSFPMNPEGQPARFVQSGEARDFFGPEGISRKAEDKYSGIVLHNILSNVRTASDLDSAINTALLDGSLAPETLERDRKLLVKRVASRPEWFSGDVTALNETSVIASDGSFHRPDRVILNRDGSVLVIDYKFGNFRPEYESQVRGYMDLYRQLGYRNVSGCLWFVYSDECLVFE